MINMEIKNLIDTMASGIAQTIRTYDLSIQDPEKLVKSELAAYMMYLSASDGKITWNEANIISEYIDVSVTPQKINAVLHEENIYSTKFEKHVPASFGMTVTADNILWDLGKRGLCAADVLLLIYKKVGKEIIYADGDADDNEIADYQTYIGMLTDYILENDRYKTNGGVYTGLKKDTGTDSGEGISAPRKG